MSFALLIAIMLGTIVGVALLAWSATAIALLTVRGVVAFVRWLLLWGDHLGR